MCVCVTVFCIWTVSGSRRFVLFVPSQRTDAVVSGFHYVRRGAAPAPRFQLYVRSPLCAGPCRTGGGCRAAVLVAGAAVAQDAV